MNDPLKAIIVDDEILARESIEALLQYDHEISVVAQCANGEQTLEAVRNHKPDLLFLDVQMPGADGFEVLSRLPAENRPRVIFITAYDQYAIKAFEVNAVDYLLKPFSRQRFVAAVSKAKAALRHNVPSDLAGRVEAILHALEDVKKVMANGGSATPWAAPAAVATVPAPEPPADPAAWKRRLLFRSDGEIHVIEPQEIRWIESEGDYVKIHAGAKTKLVRMALVKILQKLDSAHFVRIHRSAIVNLVHVRKVSPALYGEYTVELAEGVRLKVSRTYVHALKAYL
jgi:two-component system LytT family response regulator